MWLAHRGGFTAVVREGDGDAGRAKVRVLHTGETLMVDEDDLEKVSYRINHYIKRTTALKVYRSHKSDWL